MDKLSSYSASNDETLESQPLHPFEISFVSAATKPIISENSTTPNSNVCRSLSSQNGSSVECPCSSENFSYNKKPSLWKRFVKWTERKPSLLTQVKKLFTSKSPIQRSESLQPADVLKVDFSSVPDKDLLFLLKNECHDLLSVVCTNKELFQDEKKDNRESSDDYQDSALGGPAVPNSNDKREQSIIIPDLSIVNLLPKYASFRRDKSRFNSKQSTNKTIFFSSDNSLNVTEQSLPSTSKNRLTEKRAWLSPSISQSEPTLQQILYVKEKERETQNTITNRRKYLRNPRKQLNPTKHSSDSRKVVTEIRDLNPLQKSNLPLKRNESNHALLPFYKLGFLSRQQYISEIQNRPKPLRSIQSDLLSVNRRPTNQLSFQPHFSDNKPTRQLIICTFCGRIGHPMKNCFRYQQQLLKIDKMVRYACGVVGHIAPRCPNRHRTFPGFKRNQ